MAVTVSQFNALCRTIKKGFHFAFLLLIVFLSLGLSRAGAQSMVEHGFVVGIEDLAAVDITDYNIHLYSSAILFCQANIPLHSEQQYMCNYQGDFILSNFYNNFQ